MKDFVWKQVKLRKGKDTLKATGIMNGKEYEDTIELFFDKSRKK